MPADTALGRAAGTGELLEKPMDQGRSQGLGAPDNGGGAGDDYDALAELFLGDAGWSGEPDEAGPTRGPAVPAQHTLHEAGHREAPPAHDGRLQERMDEMALTARASADEGGPVLRASSTPAESRPIVELLVLGHLPVRASVWVKQYAASVSEDLGRGVGLVRSAPSGSSIELVGANDLGGARLGEASHVRAAMGDLAAHADRWIIRGEETAEAWLVEQPTVDRVTVLSGADEAAVVASYRLIKQLNASWDRVFGEGQGPELALAVLGASEGEAEAASDKLLRAAEAFLTRPLVRASVRGKVGACPSTAVYRSNGALDWSQVLPERESAHDDAEAWPSLRLTIADDAPVADDIAEPVVIEPVAVEATPGTVDRVPIAPAAEPTLEPTAEPVAEPAGAARTAPMTQALGIGREVLPGLTVLESKCPYATGVMLACDEQGRLHLVADRGGETPKAGVDALVEAEGWVRAHLALLVRAEPGLAMPSSEPSDDACGLHLVVDSGTARSVRGLLLDDRVNVHVRTAVVVDGRMIEVTTAL